MTPLASPSSFLPTNTEHHRILHDFITQIAEVPLPTMLHITKRSCATLPLLKPHNRGFRTGIEVAGNCFVCSEELKCNPRKQLPMSPWEQSSEVPLQGHTDWTLGLKILLLNPFSFHSNNFLTGRTEKPDTCHEAHGDFQLILFHEEFPKCFSSKGSANPIHWQEILLFENGKWLKTKNISFYFDFQILLWRGEPWHLGIWITNVSCSCTLPLNQ